jgi:hypothetical protein
MFDLTKKFRTRSGEPVSNLKLVENGSLWKYRGNINDGRHIWTFEGRWSADQKQHDNDLVQVPDVNLDFTKPIQTKAGLEVTILSTKGRAPYTIIGYRGVETHSTSWTQEGKWVDGDDNHHDLMNTPPVKKVMYLNLYDSRKGILTTREEADRLAASVEDNTFKHRIACVRVEYTEGQFDK